MLISTINTLFNRISSWNHLSDTEKIKAFHKAYLKLVKLKNESTVINEITKLDQQKIPILDIYKFASSNLSEYGSDYNNIEGLAHLSDEERIMILNIAQAKISTWRNAVAHQEYEFDTHREDTMVIALIYQPILTLIQKIVTFVTESITLAPVLNFTGKILELLSKNETYIPRLSISKKIWKAVGMIETYLPSLALRIGIFVEGLFDRTITLVPSLVMSFILVIEEKLQTNTFVPSLLQSSQVFAVVDYSREYRYTPGLTMSFTIIIT